MANSNRTKIAAVDLDDTLLAPDKTISPANLAALDKLQSAGYLIVLASGRRHESMRPYHLELELDTPLVSCQGAVVRDGVTEKVLYKNGLSQELGREVVRHGNELGVTVFFYHDESVYVREANDETAAHDQATGLTSIPYPDWPQVAEQTPPLKVIWSHQPTEIERYQQEFSPQYQGRLDTLITEPEYLEFIALGVSKAAGVEVVCQKYQVQPMNVVAFGDGNNDAALLGWAGLSFAMPHGAKSALQSAKQIAPAGDRENAFARAVDAALDFLKAPQTVVSM